MLFKKWISMYKLLVLLVLSFPFVLTAEIYDGVAIVVKDKAITLYDIKKEMQQDHLDAKRAADLLIRKKLESIELKKRHITVNSSEVYDDIKQMAQRNHLSVSEFYDAVRESNGLSSSELKEKIKQKLLAQKLYNAITMSAMSEPTQSEVEDYYQLHKDKFSHPASFDVIIYDAKDRHLLEMKTKNPMFYAPQIATNEQTLPYDRISPELASLLEKTPPYHFTPIVPNGKGGFMCFYIKSVKAAKDAGFEEIEFQVKNALVAEKREALLSDYFAKLRDNTEIKTIRLP